MSYHVSFAGNGDLTRFMNEYCDLSGLSVLARFSGNLAPKVVELIESIPELGSSKYGDEWQPFRLTFRGEQLLWCGLADGECAGGFLFSPVPDSNGEVGDIISLVITIFDWLKGVCQEVSIIHLGNVAEKTMADFAARAVPIPSGVLMKALLE